MMNHSLKHQLGRKRKGEEFTVDVPLTQKTARVCRCYKLQCYFSVPSLKYSVSPLSSLGLTKHTMATEQPWIHSAILPSSQPTAGCSEECKRSSEEGRRRNDSHSHTSICEQIQSGTIRSSPPISVGVAACSTNLHLCKPICQMPHVCISVTV